MYAVINDRTRQFTVRAGDEILCDFGLDSTPGSKVTFEQVQVLGNEGQVTLGHPFVAGARVVGKVLGVVQGDKLIAFRFKRRKNVRRKRGHRQDYVRVVIEQITG